MNTSDCIFCKIARGELPATKVYENGHVLAFLDIRPVSLGHTLLVPKEHATDMLDATPTMLQELAVASQKVAKAMVVGLELPGFNLAMNNGSVAGQVVFHLHWHLIPRHPSDGLRLWPARAPYPPGEAERIAEKIKANL
jgi:histidine triad (HIT) family protein